MNATTVSAAPTRPRQIGEYVLGDLLGTGGTGEVYCAEGRAGRVAIKILRSDLEFTERERRHFVDEAERMRRVRHPNLIEVVASGELGDGRPYIVMPRLVGQTLAKRLEQGPLTMPAALSYFDQLCEGVAAMHRAGLMHRDIKPDNLFLDESSERLILLDFGIARDADAPTTTTTQAGRIHGTPAYMAPERFFGTSASIATDVYELAVVFFMMVTARLPWRSDSLASSRLHPVGLLDSGVRASRSLDAMLLRALSTRPENRPATADELADMVRRAAVMPMDAAPPERSTEGVHRISAEWKNDTLISSSIPRPASQATVVTKAPSASGRWIRWASVAAGASVGIGLVTLASVRVGMSTWSTGEPPKSPPPVTAPPVPNTTKAVIDPRVAEPVAPATSIELPSDKQVARPPTSARVRPSAGPSSSGTIAPPPSALVTAEPVKVVTPPPKPVPTFDPFEDRH